MHCTCKVCLHLMRWGRKQFEMSFSGQRYRPTPKLVYVYLPTEALGHKGGRGGLSQSVFEHRIIWWRALPLFPLASTLVVSGLIRVKNHLQASESCFLTKHARSRRINICSQPRISCYVLNPSFKAFLWNFEHFSHWGRQSVLKIPK